MTNKQQTFKRTKCQHCGGWMYPDYDGFTCLICGRQTTPEGYKVIGEIAFQEPTTFPLIRRSYD